MEYSVLQFSVRQWVVIKVQQTAGTGNAAVTIYEIATRRFKDEGEALRECIRLNAKQTTVGTQAYR